MLAQTYGYFPGGRFDPRKFTPDREVNTTAEIEAWERLCAAWNAGAASVVFRSGLHAEGFRCGSPLGMGTYEIEVSGYDAEPGDGQEIPRAVIDGWMGARSA